MKLDFVNCASFESHDYEEEKHSLKMELHALIGSNP